MLLTHQQVFEASSSTGQKSLGHGINELQPRIYSSAIVVPCSQRNHFAIYVAEPTNGHHLIGQVSVLKQFCCWTINFAVNCLADRTNRKWASFSIMASISGHT